jgi:hypothetical protein
VILEYVPKPKKEGADRDDPQPLEQTELQRVIITLDPQPISQAQQEELNLQEEADNREREQKARDTQIKLEEEKAKLRAEAQLLIMKQEQNLQRLKTYFRAIEVSFHDNKENFNTTMTYCSIHHLELLENFEYYADMF